MQSCSTILSAPQRLGTGLHCSVATARLRQSLRTKRPSESARLLVCQAESEERVVSGSDLLGPKLSTVKEAVDAASTVEALAAVELNSEQALDFTKLKELLTEEDFKKADEESRSLLLQLAGEDAQSRGWIYFTEVSSIPAQDLKTIDELWKASSNGKFGYSVQKKVRLCLSKNV